MSRISQHLVREMTTATRDQINRMIALESRGWGDQKAALERIARRHSLPFWSLEHARTRAKDFKAGFAAKVRAAYVAECERQIKKLEHELAMERAMGGNDDALETAERTARELLAKVEAARSASVSRAG